MPIQKVFWNWLLITIIKQFEKNSLHSLSKSYALIKFLNKC